MGSLVLSSPSKSNAIDDKIIELLGKSIDVVGQKFKALVIYNEGSNFSLGANLGLALFAANIAAWGEIDKSIAAGQKTYKALKYAPFPVVAAPAGMALGGGCEIVLHADAVQAHAETYIGLVECGVGLIPGWGGCGEMLARWRAEPKLPRGPMPAPAKVFEGISTADVSKSAHQAMERKFLRETDGISMNRDRVLADAKQRALSMVDGYTPPKPPEFVLPGPSGRAGLYAAAEGFRRRGIATDHDLVVADALAEVLSGGDTDIIDTVTEQQTPRPRAQGLHAAGPHRAHAGKDRTYAGNRQAVAELGCGCAVKPAEGGLRSGYGTSRHGQRRPTIHGWWRRCEQSRRWPASADHDERAREKGKPNADL